MCQDGGVRRFYEEVGRRLRRARLDAGLTQQELANQVELSRASIANIEAGRQQFPLHALILFARALDIKPASLIPSTELLDAEPILPDPEMIDGLDEESKNWVRRILAPTEEVVR
jgi:transcriptional regulator with XRE-family HTH domain